MDELFRVSPGKVRDPEVDAWFDQRPDELGYLARDWRVGQVIQFKVKPAQPLRLSVSFLGHNKVAYTSWADLKAGEWQTVRIGISEIEPNPYFQPPGADKSSPIDVSHVERIGFAPQGPDKGELLIGPLVIVD